MSVKLTHLDKIYWPQGKITKGEMLKYYAKVAKTLLRYTKDRPLVMHRFPNGIQEPGFYQKDVLDVPSFVKRATISHANRKVHYILGQNVNTLLYVANLGSIEMHLFNSRVKKLESPDYMVLDLDPQAISFDAVVDTALAIHAILQKLKIPNFCKTSGGTGLHIYVPVNGKYSYEEVRRYAKIIAACVHQALPAITSLERNPKKRNRKVYIDTLQNSKGQLVVAPYSVRGFAGAPVSTPLSWSEVKHGLDPKDFTIHTVPARLSKKGDLFHGILGKGADLTGLERQC
ncbi:MAG: non-homologous end-joining DNA ligase [Verrucomicrobia bacterium]|nr:non-homologous end-joining DNA ligase [Verrucomicrobiota bacterium]MDE3047904.1 non-homologous end-joining DNA ligase [Verrucomicrobiota bacterium]